MPDFFNKYPYTDFHELNLDWILETVKQIAAEWAETLTEWHNTQEEWQQLYDYVHDYFDNLDVQEEVNNKINSMILDGSLVTLLTPVISGIVQSELPSVVSTQIDGAVAGQIDTVVASQINGSVADQIGPLIGPSVTTWLDDNVTPVGGAVVVDNSLSVAGAAADAKKTGDGLNDINNILNSFVLGTNLFTNANKTTGRGYRPSTHAYQTNASFGTVDALPVTAGYTYRLFGYSNTVNPFGYVVNNSAGSRVYDDLITGNMDITIPAGGAVMTLTYLLTDASDLYILCMNDLDVAIQGYRTHADFIDNLTLTRITLKDFGELLQPGGFDYAAFAGGVPFNGKQVFALRGAYEHLARNTIPGKVFVFESADGETFTNMALPITNADIGGELRDINLSVTRDGTSLLMTGFTNDDSVTVHIYSYLFVLDSSYNIQYRIPIGSDGDMAWGNTLETPDGYLIKAAYTRTSDIKIFRSSGPISDGFATMTFNLVATLTSGTAISEPSLFYASNKLYCITRGDSVPSVIFRTSDLEGNSGWSNAISMDITVHCPAVLPCYHESVIDFIAGYWITPSIRIPVFIQYDVIANSIRYVLPVDDTLTSAGSYPAFIKMGKNDYRVLYYDDNGSNSASALYYKKFNPYMADNAIYFVN